MSYSQSPEFKKEVGEMITHLNNLWAGDSRSQWIHRLVEILENNTTDAGHKREIGGISELERLL